MFGISGSEAVFWLVLAVVVIGPANLPRAVRAARDFLTAFRQTLDTVRSGADREITRSLQATGLSGLAAGSGLSGYLTGDVTEEEFEPAPPPPGPAPEGV